MTLFPVNEDLQQAPVRVMLVDTSPDVRNFVSHLLYKTPGLMVAACANDIQQALEIVKKQTVNVVLLADNILGIDGLTAAQNILSVSPRTRIILITDNHKNSTSFDTKDAMDYIQKPLKNEYASTFGDTLIQKIFFLSNRNDDANHAETTLPSHTAKPDSHTTTPPIKLKKPQKILTPKAIAIGSSTGGPEALIKLFKQLANQIKHTPIFITQHMPASFTTSFAAHIQDVSGITCVTPKEGELVTPGVIYLAPGDFHMQFKRHDAEKITIALTKTPPENFCRPSVDPMLRSLVEIYGKNFLTIILTGMGHDGLAGCKTVAEAGGVILAQDQASSVVWGMPGSVATEGLCSEVLPLDSIASYIRNIMGGRL